MIYLQVYSSYFPFRDYTLILTCRGKIELKNFKTYIIGITFLNHSVLVILFNLNKN